MDIWQRNFTGFVIQYITLVPRMNDEARSRLIGSNHWDIVEWMSDALGP